MKTMIAMISALLFFPALALAMSGPVEYELSGKPYQGYYITPSKTAPFVLLIHDWDGLTNYEVKRAQMLAELGYSVFAADLFGKGVRPTEVKDKKRLTGSLYKDREKMRALMYGALEKANELGLNTDNGVAVGYCFGGASVLELARTGADLKGFVSFHGRLTTPEGQDYTKTEGYVLVLHGTADTAVTMDQFADLAEELEATGVTHEMTTYSGAPHAFTVFGSKRYHERADKLSWARFVEYLNAITQ